MHYPHTVHENSYALYIVGKLYMTILYEKSHTEHFEYSNAHITIHYNAEHDICSTYILLLINL